MILKTHKENVFMYNVVFVAPAPLKTPLKTNPIAKGI